MRGDQDDRAVSGLTAEMCAAGRALLRWTQKDLGEKTGLAAGSIKRLESQPGPLRAQARTVRTIEQAFAEAGVTFKMSLNLGSCTARETVTLMRPLSLEPTEESP